MTLDELHGEMRRLSQLLDDALAYLRSQIQEYAESEDAYRLARAKAFIASNGTVQARESQVDLATSEQRKRAHLAEGMKQAALEAVRARRAQLSAVQTLVNAHREEAGFVRTGPDHAGRFESR